MRLTLHTDFALRLMMLLAIDAEEIHTIEDVSRRYGVSRHHLNKVVQTLTQAGFVETLRGRGGGVRLACEPEDINLGRVVRATEDNFHIVECFHAETNACVVTPACGLRDPLHQALAAFLSVLDCYTLADLVKNPNASRRMRRLLSA